MTRPLRIGFIATEIWNDFHIEFPYALGRRGHTVAVYTEDDRFASATTLGCIEDGNVSFHGIHSKKRNPWCAPLDLALRGIDRRFVTRLLALSRYFRYHRDFDVFIVEREWIGVSVALLQRFFRFRWVFRPHGLQALTHNLFALMPQRSLKDWLFLWALKKADYLCANSHHTQEILERLGARSERIWVIPNPVTAAKRFPEPERLGAFRAEARREIVARHALPDDASILLSCCRLDRHKGLELCFGLLAQLTERPVVLVVAGGESRIQGIEFGSYLRTLQAEAERLGVAERVHFVGHIESAVVKRYYAAADLHLAPSYVDTFNYSVLEAALVETPSLLSAACGIAPWVTKAGIGRVLATREVSKWGEAAREMLLNRPSVMTGRKALETALSPDLLAELWERKLRLP